MEKRVKPSGSPGRKIETEKFPEHSLDIFLDPIPLFTLKILKY